MHTFIPFEVSIKPKSQCVRADNNTKETVGIVHCTLHSNDLRTFFDVLLLAHLTYSPLKFLCQINFQYRGALKKFLQSISPSVRFSDTIVFNPWWQDWPIDGEKSSTVREIFLPSHGSWFCQSHVNQISTHRHRFPLIFCRTHENKNVQICSNVVN